MGSNKNKNLSWDDFQKLGNPENAPEMPQEKIETKSEKRYAKMKVRIYLDRKKRAGKAVTLVDGLDLRNDELKTHTKELQKKCGVGGSVKDGQIILQGNHRDKVLDYFTGLGVRDIKKAGG